MEPTNEEIKDVESPVEPETAPGEVVEAPLEETIESAPETPVEPLSEAAPVTE
jgi:hypothetical protein